MQGFEGFLTSKSAASKNKNRVFKLDDRAFSLSSTTSPASQVGARVGGRVWPCCWVMASRTLVCVELGGGGSRRLPQQGPGARCARSGGRGVQRRRRRDVGDRSSAPSSPPPPKKTPTNAAQEQQTERDQDPLAAAFNRAGPGPAPTGKGPFNVRSLGVPPPPKPGRPR